MTVSKTGAVSLPHDPTTVFNSLAAQPGIANMNFINRDPTTWTINATSSVSMSSWGEDVSLQIFSGQPSGTVVSLESHSSLPTTLFDMGKNQKNIDTICAFLLQMFPGGQVIQQP